MALSVVAKGNDTRSATLTFAVTETVRAYLAQHLHTGLPAEVVDYDSTTQTCTAQVVLRSKLETSNAIETDDFPLLPNVPVGHINAGGFVITVPLQKGDKIWLLFGEQSLDKWSAVGGDGVNDPVLRKYDLSDAVAMPWIRSPFEPLSGVATNAIVIGKADGSTVVTIDNSGNVNLGSVAPTDKVGLASKIKARLDALENIFAAWTPVPNDGGAALHTALVAGGWATPQTPGTANDVASAKVRSV